MSINTFLNFKVAAYIFVFILRLSIKKPARDREPLQCLENCSPSENPKSPDKSEPPPIEVETVEPMTETTVLDSPSLPSSSPTSNKHTVSDKNHPVVPSRKVRFQGDKFIPPFEKRNPEFSPFTTTKKCSGRTEDIGSTSWGKIMK